jgi:hypothetical protein
MENKFLDLDGLNHYNEKLMEKIEVKQEKLVDNINIKTINGVSVLGSEDIVIKGTDELMEAIPVADITSLFE